MVSGPGSATVSAVTSLAPVDRHCVLVALRVSDKTGAGSTMVALYCGASSDVALLADDVSKAVSVTSIANPGR